METSKGVMLLLIIALLGTTFLFFVQASAAKARVNDALILSQDTLALLEAQDARCKGVSAQEFRVIAEQCVQPLLSQDDFRREAFRQPDVRSGEPGYLAVTNTNRRAYEGEEFKFYFNRELIQEGCHIPGEIGYEVSCRFEFSDECKPGYVLEVLYGEDERVFLMTC